MSVMGQLRCACPVRWGRKPPLPLQFMANSEKKQRVIERNVKVFLFNCTKVKSLFGGGCFPSIPMLLPTPPDP